MLCESEVEREDGTHLFLVLILVLMEDALRVLFWKLIKVLLKVLILVLMEDALREYTTLSLMILL